VATRAYLLCVRLLLVDTLLVLVLLCKACLVDGSLCCRDLVTQKRRKGIRITEPVMLCVTRSHPSWGHAGVPRFLVLFPNLCVSSLREGQANVRCIVPSLTDVTEVK